MTGNSTVDHRHRFLVLDGVRGIAAIMVMVMHAGFYFPMSLLAVDLFFMLSGFVLTHAFGERLETWPQKRDFIVSRFIRLEPLWLVGCAMTIPAAIGMAIFHWADWSFPMLAVSIVTAPFFIIVPYFGISIPLNPPGWSLTFELLANFMMLVVGTRIRNAALVMLLSAPVLFWALCIWKGEATGWLDFWGGFPRVGFSFFAGVVSYRLWRAEGIPRWSPPALMILGAVALMWAIAPPWAWQRQYCMVAVFLLNPLVIWHGASSIARGRLAAVCEWLGTMSYGIYVLHAPLIFTFEGLRFLWLGAEANAYKQSGTVVWFVVPLTILIAHVLTRRFDEPLRSRLVAKLRRRGNANT